MKIKSLALKIALPGILLWLIGQFFILPYFVSATPTATFISKWSSYDSKYRMRAITLKINPADGKLHTFGFVTDPVSDKPYIHVFNSDGSLSMRFRLPDTNSSAARLAISPTGTEYWLKNDNEIIAVNGSTGVQVADIGDGTSGSGDGQFNLISDLSYSSFNNKLYVAELINGRVQALNPDGTFAFKFGTLGPADGQFSAPWRIAVSPVDGTVYVYDSSKHNIQAFDKDGNYLRKWGSSGNGGHGQFGQANGFALDVDASGNVYAADPSSCSIQKFDNLGNFLTSVGSCGTGDGQFSSISDMDVSPIDGAIYVSDNDSGGESRIQKFTNMSYASTITYAHIAANGLLGYAEGISSDSNGNVYVADSINDRVQVFDGNGSFIRTWGSTGTGNGEFSYPVAAVPSPVNGNVYVADRANNRVQIFDSSGNYLSQFGVAGSGDGQFNFPEGIAIDAAGNIYVADAGNKYVQVFDKDGSFIRRIGSAGVGDGQFDNPVAVGVSPLTGNLYVLDNSLSNIQIFSTAGSFISKFGVSGTANGELGFAEGIALDVNGNVYVADSSNNRVEMFNKDGNFLTTWGTTGTGDMEFGYPTAVANHGENVYVIDSNVGSVKKYSLDLTALPPVVDIPNVIEKSLTDINGTSESGASITISELGNTICTTTADSGGNWLCSLSFPITTIGDHVISATQTDVSGNVSSESTKTIKIVNHLNVSGSASSGGSGSSFLGSGANTTPQSPVVTPADQGQNTNAICTTQYFTEKVRFGSKGDEVKKVQQFLKDKGYYYGKTSGFYGKWTEISVKHFQEAYFREILIPLNRIEPTGIWSYSTMGLADTLQCN